jgi:Cu2+-exporting ATPase
MATNNKETIYIPLEDVESEHCALIVEKGIGTGKRRRNPQSRAK